MKYIMSRLTEPSSMASLSGSFVGLQMGLQTGKWEIAATGIIGGLLGFFMKEKGAA